MEWKQRLLDNVIKSLKRYLNNGIETASKMFYDGGTKNV